MLRLFVAITFLTTTLCYSAIPSFSANTELTGTRQPDVRDWRKFHEVNDQYWAREVTATTGYDPTLRTKIQISASDVRAMRLLRGIADDEPSDSILILQGARMKLGQYLLVSAKPKRCVSLNVYRGSARRFKMIWSIDSWPDGGEICQQDGCPTPEISVDDNYQIGVVAFSRSNPALPVCDQFSSAMYKPDHDSYAVKQYRTGPRNCWFDSYYAGLNAALKKAAGVGETLAIVQILPSLSPDRYALVLHKGPIYIQVMRMQWRPEDEPSAVYTTMRNATALQCFEHAAAVPISAANLKVPVENVQKLANELNGIDLTSDRCARRPDKTCALLLDGRSFHVQVGNHTAVAITDVKGLRGYSSENEELSAWIYRLLDETHPFNAP